MTASRRLLRVVGQDPSLRHWGLAVGHYDVDARRLTIESVRVVNPVLPQTKQTRQNSLDLEAAFQLYQGAVAAARGADAVFVEVPVGSQSARAMASYGLCVGVLGALRANGIPFFELTPTEVKLAGAGHRTATKAQMIAWAVAAHPEARWPTHRQHGADRLSESRAEHMADAVAAIHAGIAGHLFQQMLPLIAPSSPCKERHANPAQAA